jgi:hypothetical protein
MFDEKTTQQLKFYVYILLDENKTPFYVGKGIGNRVFAHAAEAIQSDISSNKLDVIRAIDGRSENVGYTIVRHGLDEPTAYAIESSLIDTLKSLNFPLTNKVLGHHALENGLMNADQIIRKYNAERLEAVGDDVVIININKKYKESRGGESIYEISRKSWAMSEKKARSRKTALIEYKGLIVEVFTISDWYSVDATDKNGKKKKRWAFNGEISQDSIRNLYQNKSVAHSKKPGSANPIRYQI